MDAGPAMDVRAQISDAAPMAAAPHVDDAAGPAASFTCDLHGRVYNATMVWTINDHTPPTIDRDGETWLVVSKSWQRNRNWLKIITGKAWLERERPGDHEHRGRRSSSGMSLGTCDFAKLVIDKLRAVRGKPTRMARRVDTDGQFSESRAVIVLAVDDVHHNIDVLNDITSAYVLLSPLNLRLVLTALANEFATGLSVRPNRQPSTTDVAAATVDGTVEETDSSDSDSDGGGVPLPPLPKGVTYNPSRRAYVVTLNDGSKRTGAQSV